MEVKIVIKNVRIYFEDRLVPNIQLALKVSAATNISTISNLTWNRFCKRWEYNDQVSLTAQNIQVLKIQVLKHMGLAEYQQLFQEKIQLESLPQTINEEFKICLTMKGQVMGWLYCQFQKGKKPIQKQQSYLNIHRLTTSFLDMRDEECTISIYLNNSLIFIKEIHLRLRKRTIFPNIKQPIKKSDLLIFEIDSKRQKARYNMYLIDHLQRGNTALLKAWVRNKFGNKMGEFQIEYFLQNFYLPNAQPDFSAKQIQIIKEVPLQQALTKKERQDLRFEVHIDSFTNLENMKSQKNKNTLLRRVILGERRRRNLVYVPENASRVKKKTTLQMDEILEDQFFS